MTSLVKTFLTRILPWILFVGVCLLWWKSCDSDEADEPKEVIVTSHMVVNKIETLGKLELTKFYIKDILEYTELKEKWYKSRPELALIINGEVIGCIDLTKVDSNSVMINDDSIVVKLPEPEICSYKINHKDSKVYNIQTSIFEDDEKVIDLAYQYAENQILLGAKKMGILEQTRKNAAQILVPILENMTGKKVVLK